MLAFQVACGFFRAFEHRLTQGIQRNVSGPMLLWTMILWTLAWVFFPFESKAWQRVRRDLPYYYPHVNFLKLKPLDPIRILLQSVFLIFYNPSRLEGPSTAERISIGVKRLIAHSAEHGVLGWIGEALQRMTNLYTKGVAHVAGDRVMLPVRYRFLVIGLLAVATVALLSICITQPLDIKNQTVFLVAMWLLALILKRIKSHFTLMALFVISLIVSSRYLWWRYTQTLNFDTAVGVVSSLLLIFA